MQVELRPIDELKPYEQNPRQNDAAVDAVAKSIREYGFRQPIVVDAEGVMLRQRPEQRLRYVFYRQVHRVIRQRTLAAIVDAEAALAEMCRQ